MVQVTVQSVTDSVTQVDYPEAAGFAIEDGALVLLTYGGAALAAFAPGRWLGAELSGDGDDVQD